MDLKSLLRAHPSVRILNESDNEKILDFYNRLPMEGESIRLRSDRSPDFFKLLRCQSDNYVAFGFFDRDELVGLGSFSSRAAFLKGEKVNVNYACDLRLKFNREVIRGWRSFYGDVIKNAGELSEFGASNHFYTSVIDENRKARLALTEKTKSNFNYSEASRYAMVNIFFKLPWPHGSTSDGANIRRAVLEDEKKVIEFLDFQHRQKIFGFRFQDGEWERRKRTWPGFSIENFMIAETAAGKIIGCCAPWTASDVKANIIEKYPFVFRLMTLFKNIPRFGEKLKTTYLTHLEIDSTLTAPQRQQIFRRLFDQIFVSTLVARDSHMISFCDFDSSPLRAGLKGPYIFQTVPMALYTVSASASTPEPRPAGETGFEMALV